MNTSPSMACHLLAVLLLAMLMGCQQEAPATDTPTESNAAQSQADAPQEETHAVKTVAAEQPIQYEAKVAEPDILAAPLESEIEADDAPPVLILDTIQEPSAQEQSAISNQPSATTPSP